MKNTQVENEASPEISQIIELLVTPNKIEDIIKSSNDLKVFIQANKPGLQFLEVEFEIFFSKPTDLEILLPHLTIVFQCWQSLNFNALPFKGLLKGLFKIHKLGGLVKNSENLSLVKTINDFVSNSWKFLSTDIFKDFFPGFETEIIQKPEKINYIKEKITQNLFADAIKALNYFNLFDDFDRKSLTLSVIQRAKGKKERGLYEILYRLIKDHPTVDDTEYINFLIFSLCTNETVKNSAKIIRKYKLDIKSYPDVLERMKKKALRYVLWEKEWIGCEERFCLYDEMLGYLVEELFHKEKYQEAYSIIVRYDLLSKGLINKKEPKEYFEKHKEYKILDNPIFEKDSFNPVEENVEKVKEGYYINLRDFGIKEENVYYIDDIKDSLFHYSMKQLEKSEMVGLDSEFIMTSTSFENGGISIFQIANDKEGFIYDMEKISHLPEFQEFFFGLLANKDIIKIGHTISADIKMLGRNQSLSLGNKGYIRNYIEIPQIFKALNPGDKFSSLAHIAETILNKPMSKGDQCSNWSKKPLRKSQMHYGALDSVICVMIFKEMKNLCEKAKLNVKEFHNDILLGDPNTNSNENGSGDESHGSNKSEEFKEKNDDKNVKKSKNKTKNKKKQHEESKKTEISDTINLNTQKQKEIESLFDDN